MKAGARLGVRAGLRLGRATMLSFAVGAFLPVQADPSHAQDDSAASRVAAGTAITGPGAAVHPEGKRGNSAAAPLSIRDASADGTGVTDILVHGVDIGRFSPGTLEYIGAVGAAFTGATVQVDAAEDTLVTVTPADSDTDRDGHQIAMAADLGRLTVVVRAVPAGESAIEYRIVLDRDLADIVDDQVLAAVAAQLGKEAASLLAVADLAAVETLDLSRRPVSDLAGLESATGLRELFLGSNRVDLAPIDGLGASVRHAMTPGIGSIGWSSDELWRPATRLETVERLYGVPLGMGRAFMADGHLVTIMAIDGGQATVLGSRAWVSTIAVWDISDPRNARRVRMYDRKDTHDLRGPHGLGLWHRNGRTLLAAQTFRGIALFDVTEIGTRLERLSDLALPGNRGGSYGGSWWLAVQAPYIYVAEVGAGLTIVDASDPSSPQVAARLPTGALGGVSPGSVFAVGNLLVVAEPSGRGYATLDISDPVRPFLIEAGDTFKGYSHHFTAGWLLTLGAHGVFVSGSPEDGDSPKDLGDQNRLYLHRVGHDGRVAYVGEAGNGLGRGGYGSYQDGHFLGGFSTKVAKFSIDPPALIGRGTGGMSDRDEEFVQPLGNLLFVGDDHGVPSPLIPHAAEPDTVGPEVIWRHPPDGAEGVAVTGRVGASMSDEIAASSLLPESFQVTSRAGAPVRGELSVNQNNVNFSPRAPLEPGATYDVAVCGLADLMGNLGGCSRWSFATASSAVPPPRCSLGKLAAVEVGVPVAYAPASVSGAPTSYRWQVGDDAVRGPQAAPEAEFTHAASGRFPVTLTVSNDAGSRSCGAMRIVYEALTESQPTASSSIAVGQTELALRPGDPKNGSLLGTGVYVANPDNASVTRIDVENRKVWEVRVGAQPRTLAVGPEGNVWVAVEGAGRVVVLDRDGGRVRSIGLGYGSAPYGIAFAPDGGAAYVTLGGTGQLVRLSPAGAMTGRIAVGPRPRGVAVSADSRRVFMTRFVTRFAESDGQGDDDAGGEVYEVDASDFTLARSIDLGFDPGPDTESSGRGVPNYLSQVRISPDGRSAWVPSKKDNIARGAGRDGQALDFESQARAIASRIDLETNAEVLASRIDFDDRSLAQAMAFTPLGDALVIAFGGSDVLEVWDANALARLGEVAVGRAPLGMAFRPDGRRLYVHNHLDRSVTVLNTIGLTDGTANEPTEVATVSTVAQEALSPAVLRGKRLFYNAADPRMSRDGYIACAGCHLDGGSDGMVWDRTQFGEGFRNTIDLRGRFGATGGRVHWSANFDEIQDFEHDIRDAFGGTGFMTEGEYGAGSRGEPLGDPKAGVSGDLDDLAAYVTSLDTTPASPHRTAGGGLTEAGVAGRAVFAAKRCASCHAGAGFTDERMHDVGTHSAGGGLQAVNTPTLRGLWTGAPFHHDGSAATLADVLSNEAHMGGTLTDQEKTDLEAYLRQIDDRELAPLGLDSSGEAELAALAITAGLSASGNDQPFGLWGDGETLWVADNSDGRVYAYGLADGVRQRDREIDSAAHGNRNPTGLWSDGETLWVGDSQVSRLFAYGLSGERRESRDIALDEAFASDIWGDGETLWVLDDVGRLRAYGLADGTRRPERDETLDEAMVWPTGVWSDGSRLLVLDAGQRVPELKVYRDGTLSVSEGITLPVEDGLLQALWSDGHALWVIDGLNGTLHTYALEPPSSNATLTLLRLSGVQMESYAPSRTAYAGETVSAATTVTAHAASGASLAIAPEDADPETDGHQVSLEEGDNAIAVTVTAADGTTERNYALTVTRALDPEATVPSLSVEAVSDMVAEGAGAVFRVSRAAATARPLDVALTVSESGSVLLGTPPATVTIAEDSTTAELSVATEDDRVDEGDGSVTVTLQTGVGYTLGAAPSATVSVTDNDLAAFAVTVTPAEIAEGESATVTVSIANGVTFAQEQRIDLEVTGAVTVSDYALEPATLALAPGSRSVAATLTASEDAADEPDEALTVTARLGETSIGSATLTVSAPDVEVVVSAVTASVAEGAPAEFELRSTPAPTRPLAVQVSVAEAGSTLAGEAPASLTFPAGAMAATLSVPTDDDRVEEGGGSVTAALQPGDGYVLGEPSSATVTVADDDVTEYRLALDPEEVGEGDTATVTVSTAGLVTRAAERELALRVSGLSAADYRLEPSTVVLGPEATARATATLTALDDGRKEPRERGVLTLLEDGAERARQEFTIRAGEKLYVSGVPQVGGTLTAPELAGTGSTEHQWLRKGEAIPGATGSSHVLTGPDEGAELSVRVTRAGVTRLSEATVPIWGVPGNPPLRANEEELLGTLLTVGFTRAYPIRLGGYGRVSRASFGSLDDGTLSYGGASVELTVALVNELGEFSVGPPLGTLSEEVLWAYWDGHRIGPLERSGSSELEVLSAPTPQERVLYRRYGRAESEGVRVALSIRREVGPPTVTLSVGSDTVTEGSPAVFELSLDRAPDTALEVPVEVTADGEVLADAVPASVTVEAGSTAATLALPTVDDTVVEGDGSVTVTLLAGDGYALGETVSATVAVEDDDVAEYALTVTPTELVEGASATVRAELSNGVTYAEAVSLELSVTGEVTAADYALDSALPELAAGESVVATTLTALADAEDEALETAQLAMLLDGAEVATTALSIRDASADATLSVLELSDVDLGGFDPETTSYTATVMAELSSTLVTAEPADANAAVEIADASGSTLGTERTSTLATGDNEIAATVTAEDGVTERTYAVTVTREAGSGWGARVPERDVSLSDVVDPTGVWSDGATLWVSDWDRILAYALVDGARLPSRDVSGLSELQSGLWSDGATLWQSDQAGAVRAFRLSDGARTPDADLPAELLVETGNGAPAGMWSDAAGLRVVDLSDGVVYGYGADGARAPELDLDLRQGSSSFPWGLWSDGAMVLVTWFREGTLSAFRLSDGVRLPERDIELAVHGNDDPRDVWSDGETLWVVDGLDRKLYAYAVPGLE